MKKLPVLVCALLVAGAVLTPAAEGYAASLSPVGPTDPDATLPTTSFVALVVDSAHHHLFMSTGAVTNSLMVTDQSGVVKKTMDLAGASGMTLAGNRLYVAERGANEIAVIDTATLKVVNRLGTGANTCPTSVALAASRYVTYGYTCDRQWGGVGVIDVEAGTPTPQAVASGLFYNPIVRAVPHSTTVIVGSVGLSSPLMTLIDAAGVPTTLKMVWDLPNECGNLQDLAVNPDGKSFVPACGWPYRHDAFSTTDFSQVEGYASGIYPAAAAFSPDGKTFAGGTESNYSDVLYVRSTTPAAHILGLAKAFGNNWGVAPQGLGFASDGDTVFAVTMAWFGTGTWAYHLHVLTVPDVASHIDLLAQPATAAGTRFAVTGRLTFADGQQLAVQLKVTRKLNAKSVTLPAVTTANDGTFAFTDTPDKSGATTYTVTYAGDPFHGSSKSSVTVQVQ
jgi:YVTN family beta-propeller protein